MKIRTWAIRKIPSFLWKPLILPFCALAFACLLLARLFASWNGILTNLAATFIGILVTVLYVEYILRKHEEQRWAPAVTVIHRKVGSFIVATFSTIRLVLNTASDIPDYTGIDINDAKSLGKEMIGALEGKVLPALDGNVRRLNKAKWKLLAHHLRQTQERADRLYQHYGARLAPELLGLFMNFQEGIDTILAIDGMFTDTIGTPWGSPYGIKQGLLEETTVSMLRSICEAAVKLMRGLIA